jgi:hypothetical protein
MESKLTINEYDTKRWILPNGKYHREDGPAIEHISGTKSFYLNGISYNEQEYKYEIRSRKLKQLL